MKIVDGLRYTANHEWVLVDGESARIGITDHAQDALGTIVYVGLPEVGATVAGGALMAEVESSKTMSDIYSPISGSVVLVNEALVASPDLLNTDPFGAGWLVKIRFASLPDLLTEAEYKQHIGEA